MLNFAAKKLSIIAQVDKRRMQLPLLSARRRGGPAAVQALIELSWQLSLHDLRLETRKTRETRVRTLPWANSGQVTTDHPGPIDLHLPSQAKSKL